MQTPEHTKTYRNIHPHGARVSTPQLRRSLKLSQEYEGLDHDANRYDLLILVKRAGMAAGFSPRLIQLLDYYMSFTREIDWQEGANPIVYQSLTRTAMELGVCERQVQRMEQRLFELGAITWCDSGNHRRYGYRDPESGEIIYAFGVDLTPLATLAGTLQRIKEQKTKADQHWLKTKRQVSWYRAQVRSMLAAIAEDESQATQLNDLTRRYETISAPLRRGMDISTLTSLLEHHKSLHGDLLPVFNDRLPCGMSTKESPRDDKNVAHIQYTKKQQLDESKGSPQDRVLQEGREGKSQPKLKQGSKDCGSRYTEPEKQPPEPEHSPEAIILKTGLQHITLKQTLNAASERFRAQIPLEHRAMNWSDIIEAAYKLRQSLHISQHAWGRACQTLGRTGAAIALLVTDQAAQRDHDHIRQTGAYFNAMITRAGTGELNLHASVFGLLKREEA